MFNREIFRKTAMDKLSTPDDLDELLQVNSKFSWLVLVSMLCLILCAGIWGFFGRIVNRVTMTGAIQQINPPQSLLAVESGQVDSVFYFTGDRISKGQTILTYASDPLSQSKSFNSSCSGELIELNIWKGDLLTPGKIVAKVQKEATVGVSQSEFVFFVSDRVVGKLAAGQDINILFQGRNSESVKLNSRIKYIGKIPATIEAIAANLPDRLVAEQMKTGSYFLVRSENVVFSPDENQNGAISMGDLTGKIVAGEAIISKESPIDYLLSPSK